MLTVNVEKRSTIDECLQHPWLTQSLPENGDSFDGLTGAMNQLDFSKRKVHRERTLLSEINDIKVTKVINVQREKSPVFVFGKNSNSNGKNDTKRNGAKGKEQSPSAKRDPNEFMKLGGRGDQALFGYDGESRYS
jgi:serine/threonine-protein kinase Chk2